MDKTDKRVKLIRTDLGGTPPRLLPLTEPRQPFPPRPRNKATAQPGDGHQDDDDDTPDATMKNRQPDQEAKSSNNQHPHQQPRPHGRPGQPPAHPVGADNHGGGSKQKEEQGNHSPSPPPLNPSRSF